MKEKLIDKSIEKSSDYIQWNQTGGYILDSVPVVINAPIDTVWKYVLDINNYEKYSDNTTYASVNTFPKPGDDIEIQLYRKLRGCCAKEGVFAGCRNSLFAKVTHKITQVKDEQDEKILEWSHKFNENYSSERKQVLRSFDNGRKTISYLADKVPGPIGVFVNYVLKTAVENSFEKLSNGIKKAAEQDYKNSLTL